MDGIEKIKLIVPKSVSVRIWESAGSRISYEWNLTIDATHIQATDMTTSNVECLGRQISPSAEVLSGCWHLALCCCADRLNAFQSFVCKKTHIGCARHDSWHCQSTVIPFKTMATCFSSVSAGSDPSLTSLVYNVMYGSETWSFRRKCF